MAKTTYTKVIIIEKLQELYPNKVVKGLSKDHKALYNVIQLKAKKSNVTNKEYIHSLGFLTKPPVVQNLNKPIGIKCNRCSKILPEGYKGKSCPSCVEQRRQQGIENRNIREKNHQCTKCGVDLQDGYEYKTCSDCRETSTEAVSKLRSDRIANHDCEHCGIKLDEGYKLRFCPVCNSKRLDRYHGKNPLKGREHTIKYTKQYITKLLVEHYGEQKNVTGIQQVHYNLYFSIYRNAKKENMTFNEYLKDTGYYLSERGSK